MLSPRARGLLAEVDDALVLLGKGRTGVVAALRAAGVARVVGAAPAARGARATGVGNIRRGADRRNSLSRLREREGPAAVRPWEGEGRRRHPAFPHPSHPSGMGPFPLPQAGEGPIAIGGGAKVCASPPPLRGRVGRGVEASPLSFLAPWPPGPAHAARRLVAALAALDGGTEAAWPGSPRALAEHPLLRLEPREIEQALRQLNLAAPPPRGIVALHPGSGGAAKCWPAKRFAELAAAAARHWGVLPVFLIGPADASAWHEVQAALPPSLAALALIELPLREVLALLSLARAYVGNDFGDLPSRRPGLPDLGALRAERSARLASARVPGRDPRCRRRQSRAAECRGGPRGPRRSSRTLRRAAHPIRAGSQVASSGKVMRITSRTRSVTTKGITPLKMVENYTSWTTLLMTKTFMPTGGWMRPSSTVMTMMTPNQIGSKPSA